MKEDCDFVIVLYHGGKEHYRYPSPYLQKIFRKFIDVGADFVVAQHTHCIGCKEEYRNGTLVYGQGNFIFDSQDNEFWNTSLLISINFDKNFKHIDYIPIRKIGNTIELATDDDSIIDGFYKRSVEIIDDNFIKSHYGMYANSMYIEYLHRIAGGICRLLPIRIINKLTNYKLLKLTYGLDYLPAIENCLECEAHKELFACYLAQRRKRNAFNK